MNNSYHDCVQVFSFIGSNTSVRLDYPGRNNNEYCIGKFNSHMLENRIRILAHDYKVY
jgi:hypothetical protein